MELFEIIKTSAFIPSFLKLLEPIDNFEKYMNILMPAILASIPGFIALVSQIAKEKNEKKNKLASIENIDADTAQKITEGAGDLIDRYRQFIDEIRVQAEESTEKLQKLDNKVKQLTETNEQYIEQHKILVEQNKILVRQNKQLSEQNKQLSEQNMQLSKQNAKLLAQLKTMSEQNKSLSDRIGILEKKLKEV